MSAPAAARLAPLFILGATTVALLGMGLAAGRATGFPARAALGAAGAGGILLASVRMTGRPGPRASGAVLVTLVALPLLAATAGLFAPGRLEVSPSVVAGLAGAPGRFFPFASDGSTLASLARETGGEWGGATASRARAALSGYTNLPLGLSSAASPSPIGNPWRMRLFGVALSGGNAEMILSLADVRHIVSPFPVTIPGARLERQGGGVFLYTLSRAAGRVFFARSAREADDAAAFRALAAPDFDPEGVVLLAPPAGPLPPARAGKTFSVARVVADAPELLTVDAVASEAGFLVLTRAYDHGWEARVDGTRVPLLRADLALSAVLLPAGAHRLELVYRPVAFRAGAAISLASLVILAGLVLAGKRRS